MYQKPFDTPETAKYSAFHASFIYVFLIFTSFLILFFPQTVFLRKGKIFEEQSF